MPFSAELRVPVQGSCLKSLRLSNTVRSAIEQATEWDGKLRIEILHLLLLTDVYGHSYQHSEHDVELWKTAASTNLLTEIDITNPRHEGLIGRWNLPLLRWLKGISIATQETFIIDYDHERGDTPYEYVWWASSPASAKESSETFGLSSHGGMDEAEWKFEIVRFADGRSQVKEEGQCGDPPRYL